MLAIYKNGNERAEEYYSVESHPPSAFLRIQIAFIYPSQNTNTFSQVNFNSPQPRKIKKSLRLEWNQLSPP